MSSLAPAGPAISEGIQIQNVASDAGSEEEPHRPGIPEKAWLDGASVETAIVLEVTVALVAHPPTELTVIEVNNSQGIVTLSGQVGSVHLHAMAGEIAGRHPGVESTVNALEIRERPDPGAVV